jgi:hypothetical protein
MLRARLVRSHSGQTSIDKRKEPSAASKAQTATPNNRLARVLRKLTWAMLFTAANAAERGN